MRWLHSSHRTMASLCSKTIPLWTLVLCSCTSTSSHRAVTNSKSHSIRNRTASIDPSAHAASLTTQSGTNGNPVPLSNPFSVNERQIPSPTETIPNTPSISNSSGPPKLYAKDGTYLGRLSANQYDPESISNPYGKYGSPYSSTSINNPYSTHGSQYSSEGVRNPYTSGGPRVVGSGGTFLGHLNKNRFDPKSTSNPFGQHGSPYSSTSINNPYSKFGSPYSSQSANNPFATSSGF